MGFLRQHWFDMPGLAGATGVVLAIVPPRGLSLLLWMDKNPSPSGEGFSRLVSGISKSPPQAGFLTILETTSQLKA